MAYLKKVNHISIAGTAQRGSEGVKERPEQSEQVI